MEHARRYRKITGTGAMALLFLMFLATACKTTKTSVTTPDNNPGGIPDVVTSAMMEVSEKYIDATREKMLGNFAEAEKLLLQCLKLDPEHHPSYYQLADIGHIKGTYPEALDRIEEAVRLDPANGWYRVLKAELLLKLGRYKESVLVYQELNRLWPTRKIWYEGRAYALKMAGEERAAAAAYEEILRKFGFDEEIFFKMIDLYEKSGDYKSIMQKLKGLVEKNPYETRYLGYLASFYQKRGDSGKALPLWNEILRLEPGNGEVRFELANYYRGRGEDEKAFQELLLAFGSPNLSIDAKIVVLLSYYKLSEQYPILLKEAYQLLDLTVEKHPENPKGWSMYADFLMRDRKHREALQNFLRVTDLDSSRYFVWEQLLYCADVLNDFKTLATHGERALRVFPDQSALCLFHGRGLLYIGETQQAVKVLNQGLYFAGLNDSLTSLLYHTLARCEEVAGNVSKSGEAFRKALAKGLPSAALLADYIRFIAINGEVEKAAPARKAAEGKPADDPMMQLFYLWNRRLENSQAEIISDLARIVQQYPNDYNVLEQSGYLYQWLGKPEKATESWQKALEISSGNKLIENALQRNTP